SLELLPGPERSSGILFTLYSAHIAEDRRPSRPTEISRVMSSWATGQLKYAVGLGSIMSFYGIVGAIVLMMPEGSIGRNQKVIVIVLLLLTLPFTLLTGYLAARRSKKKAKNKATDAAGHTADAPAADAPAAKTAAPAGTYPDITSSTEEVVQFLKSSNLGEGGKDAIYSLPWY